MPALPACEAGKEGPTCSVSVNECLRGLDNCGENAACVDTDAGFECECYYGYSGDGIECAAQPDMLAELEAKYFTTPQAVSCQLAVPVDWPIAVPGGLYDPLDSQVCTDESNLARPMCAQTLTLARSLVRQQYVIDLYGGHRGSAGQALTLVDCMMACQMEASCEAFVINEVQVRLARSRALTREPSLTGAPRSLIFRASAS